MFGKDIRILTESKKIGIEYSALIKSFRVERILKDVDHRLTPVVFWYSIFRNHPETSLQVFIIHVSIPKHDDKNMLILWQPVYEKMWEYLLRSKLSMLPMLRKKWVRSMSPNPPRPGRKGSGVNKWRAPAQ